MEVSVYLILHALVIGAWAPGGTCMRQFDMQRLCKTIDRPTGMVLEISPRQTYYECAIFCFETFTCSSFSFQTDPGNNQGECYLYTGEVTCGTESTSPTAWSTYSFGNETHAPECDNGWDLFRNSCYFLVTLPRGWPASRDYCISTGGQLASIADGDENEFIMNLPVIYGHGTRVLWLGGNDLTTEGVWKWLSGEPWAYTNFNMDEPNGGLNENELAMLIDGRWMDLYWDNIEFSVCEKPL